MSKVKATLTPLAALLLTACASPVALESSGIDTPAGWHQLAGVEHANEGPFFADAAAAVDQTWWRRFNDPVLDTLIDKALTGSKSLQIAAAKVQEARASRMGAASALYPQVNAQASSQRGNQGYATNDQTATINQAGLAASWELDLFGANQARTAQAGAVLQSAQAREQAVRVALLAEVARTYFELRDTQRQLALTRTNLESQRETLALIHNQLNEAMASDFDVQRTAAQVSATESRIPVLRSRYDATANRLDVLLGLPPGSKTAALEDSREFSPLDRSIVVSAPATVLASRPDIRAAERDFAVSISAREAATAALFPNISLTAFFGAQDATPFSSTPWSLAAGLIQPVLNFGKISAQIDVADARQKQAFLYYQETVLRALEDMENALSSYGNETARNVSLNANVAQTRKAAELASAQFRYGYIGLLDVLVAERDLLAAESSLAASDAKLRSDLVRIYAAAGGGWQD